MILVTVNVSRFGANVRFNFQAKVMRRKRDRYTPDKLNDERMARVVTGLKKVIADLVNLGDMEKTEIDSIWQDREDHVKN